MSELITFKNNFHSHKPFCYLFKVLKMLKTFKTCKK